MDKSHFSKPIPDFPGYAVTSDGRIISLPRKVWNGKGFLMTKEKELCGNARHAEIEIFGDYKRRISCALRHGGTVYGHKFIKL